MKKYIFLALAAIAALSSCAKESLVSNEENGKESQVFNATIEDCVTTKATFDATNKCALWEVNDEISINGKKYKAQSAGTTTTFAAIDGEAEGPTYNAFFPAGLYNGTNAILPADVSETWADSKFNMPMYAESSTFDLSFKNLCGVLKITVTNAQLASVKCITVSSTNKAVSGAFTVSGDAAVLADASKTANTVTVTYTEAVNTDAEKVFYVAIPAQTYKNLSIAVSDGTTTKVMTTKKDQDITVARKTIYPITFKGQPTTGTAKATIGGSEVDVNWVQLWAGGPKFAEYNVGASSATDGGSAMKFTDAIKTGSDYVWGSNWCTPSKEDMEHLMTAASSSGSEKVRCEIVRESNVETGIIIGFKFTGKETGYTGNSVFFPAQNGNSNFGDAYYWSATAIADVSKAWIMNLYYGSGVGWGSIWTTDFHIYSYHVRPVLEN